MEYGNYTFCVIGDSEKENVKALKREYLAWDKTDFNDGWKGAEYHGVCHREVQIGKVEAY
jgi:hypothetical protein